MILKLLFITNKTYNSTCNQLGGMMRYRDDNHIIVFDTDPLEVDEVAEANYLLKGIDRRFITDFIDERLDDFYEWFGKKLDIDLISTEFLIEYMQSDMDLGRKFFSELAEDGNYGIEALE